MTTRAALSRAFNVLAPPTNERATDNLQRTACSKTRSTMRDATEAVGMWHPSHPPLPPRAAVQVYDDFASSRANSALGTDNWQSFVS